jgi:hypothetical protein
MLRQRINVHTASKRFHGEQMAQVVEPEAPEIAALGLYPTAMAKI